MGDPSAEVTPSELKFRFQLNKQLPAAISIYNPSNERQAFKVKTTTPKKYVVRPSSGVVEPKSTANVQVIMQVQKELPTDFANCKDKFLVQVKCLEPSEEVTQDTFKSPKGVKDTKIRVVLEGPPAPPSPVPEVNEVDEDSMRTGAHADGLSPAAAAAAAGTAAAAARAGAGTGTAAADAASLSQENRALKAQLERMVVERDTLRGKLDKANKAGSLGAASSSRKSSSGLAAMSLLPVLIVGILAFLMGHYIQELPVISKMMGKD